MASLDQVSRIPAEIAKLILVDAASGQRMDELGGKGKIRETCKNGPTCIRPFFRKVLFCMAWRRFARQTEILTPTGFEPVSRP